MMQIIPFSEAPVLVIGAAGVDVVGHLKAELQKGSSTPARIRFSYGGVARNIAENLARLGHPVHLMTVVGSGYFGEQLLAQVSDSGVNVQYSIRTDEPTGAYFAALSKGEKQFALDDMHSIAALTPAYLREHYELFKNASLLVLDANLPKRTLKSAFSLARRYKLPVVADPTSVSLASRLKPYLPQLSIITPNSAEAAQFFDQKFEDEDYHQAVDAAKYLVSLGVDIALVTLAEFGVSYATSETSGYIQAIRTEIVDPTGAGDALTAAVIFSLLNNIPIDDAVRLGVSAASLTLRHRGAVVPDLSLEKLYSQLVI